MASSDVAAPVTKASGEVDTGALEDEPDADAADAELAATEEAASGAAANGDGDPGKPAGAPKASGVEIN